jgi:hypothetical protein
MVAPRSATTRRCEADGFELEVLEAAVIQIPFGVSQSSFETAAAQPPQDEVITSGKIANPHGEETREAGRLEP